MKALNKFSFTGLIIAIVILFILYLILFHSNSSSEILVKAQEKFDKHHYKECISELSIIIKDKPDFIDAYILRSRAKNEMSDKLGAVQDLTTAINIDSTNSFAYFARGFIHQLNNNLDFALIDYSKSLTLKPSYAAYNNRANILSDKCKYKEALDDYNLAIKLEPNDTLAYINRGKLKVFHLDDKESGCLDFSKAGELGSSEAYELIKDYCK